MSEVAAAAAPAAAAAEKLEKTARPIPPVLTDIINLILTPPPEDVTTYQNLEKVKQAMIDYIATPWDPDDKAIMSVSEYNAIRTQFTKYLASTASTVDETTLCSSCTDDPDLKKYKALLCQGHSGNLFEHSQWSALQILLWYKNNDDIMTELTDPVDLETTIIAAFFHDIAKGGDCISTTSEVSGEKWFDLYSVKKYPDSTQVSPKDQDSPEVKEKVEALKELWRSESNDRVHPIYCSDMILGKIKFKVKCSPTEEIDIKDLIKSIFTVKTRDDDKRIKEIALISLMHWEFGKLNMPGVDINKKIETYLASFENSCDIIQIDRTDNLYLRKLLNMCIAVSCADIAGASNIRLKDEPFKKWLIENHITVTPSEEKYLGKDNFVGFGMSTKYNDYREKVIRKFDNPDELLSGGGVKHRRHPSHSSRRSKKRRTSSLHSRRQSQQYRIIGGRRRTCRNRKNKRSFCLRRNKRST